MRFFITGGAGFMGSNFVRYIINKYSDAEVLVYDKLTYAGRLENLQDIRDNPRFHFVKADICDEEKLLQVLKEFQPDVIVNFAAETHVDRSINEPAPFLKTNVLGVFNILEATRKLEIPLAIHISTDEVYGDLWGKEPASEETPFRPSSPYSASKASGDLLCQAYWRTYRLPVIIVRPSNNYGPYQFPEKLIPKTIIRALHDKPIPVYGRGDQVRDWLFVEDFCEALDTVINKGSKGEAYNIPGLNEKKNIEVVETILKLMGKPLSLIKFVDDRPGHDRRYAMKGDKILSLGWKPKTPWVKGLEKTIKWYLDNKWWWKPLLSDDYFQLDTPWKKR
ncbi:dTDP-glucose 4,6-dehydratase [Desulfurococcaceae archaeon MEX13E-LK6-19]|nr:dTDP-glucose 4,6-dehydratase [Desulfurococcaceae archaeon MEX13E-LK6-19]